MPCSDDVCHRRVRREVFDVVVTFETRVMETLVDGAQ